MKVRQTIAYFAFACGISWAIAGVMLVLKIKWNSPQALPFGIFYMYGPALATFLCLKIFKEKFKQMGIKFRPNWWFLLAAFIPLTAALISIPIAHLLPGISITGNPQHFFERLSTAMPPEKIQQIKQAFEKIKIHPFWLAISNGIFAAFTINAVAAFGEELGWRGYLYYLLREAGFWKYTLITGILWGVWHTPAILMGHNWPHHPVAGVFLMIVFCLLLSPIMTVVRDKSKSVIAASIAHGSVNAFAGLPFIVLKGGGELTVGLTGLSGFTALVIVNILILLISLSAQKSFKFI